MSCSVCVIFLGTRGAAGDDNARPATGSPGARAPCECSTERALSKCRYTGRMPTPIRAQPGRRPLSACIDAERALALGRDVLATEAAAIDALQDRLGDDFVAAAGALFGCRGRVVVTGIGKSGHIARKLAATLASTGTPAFFVHAAEAGHGDLGMITRRRRRAAACRTPARPTSCWRWFRISEAPGAPLIALTGNEQSSLARRPTCISMPASTAKPVRSACADGAAPPPRWRWATRWRCLPRRARLFGRRLRPLASWRTLGRKPVDPCARRHAYRRRAADGARPRACCRRDASR